MKLNLSYLPKNPCICMVFAFAIVALGCADLETDLAAEVDAADTSGEPDSATAAPDISDWERAPTGECGPRPGETGYDAATSTWFAVDWVADGDTVLLDSGQKVRFLGIDTPETASADCYASAAKTFVEGNVPKGATVCLTADSKAGNVDAYDRLLRYVYIRNDGKDVLLNARLLRLGLARVYNQFAKGLRHEQALRNAEFAAKSAHLGGWKDCGW